MSAIIPAHGLSMHSTVVPHGHGVVSGHEHTILGQTHGGDVAGHHSFDGQHAVLGSEHVPVVHAQPHDVSTAIVHTTAHAPVPVGVSSAAHTLGGIDCHGSINVSGGGSMGPGAHGSITGSGGIDCTTTSGFTFGGSAGGSAYYGGGHSGVGNPSIGFHGGWNF